MKYEERLREHLEGLSLVTLSRDEAMGVADLIAAVREERRLSHRMDAYSSRDLKPGPQGQPSTITTLGMEYAAAHDAVDAKLAALDEAAGR